MKFWAFLKDSYREAVSGWVLPTMFILVGVFALLVASVSFRPVSAEEYVTSRLKSVQMLLTFRDPNSGRPVYSVENFRQTNIEVDPWKGDYSFDIVATYRSEEDFKRGQRSMVEPRTGAGWRGLFAAFAPELTGVTVGKPAEERTPPPPGVNPTVAPAAPSLRFPVTTLGTAVEDRKSWQHAPAVLFGAFELPIISSQREWVYRLQKNIVNDFGAWVILLVAVIVSAGFVPNTMRKGALDLLISKPVGRLPLLLYKYVGGLVFAGLLIAFAVGAVYLIVGLRFDFWALQFLGMIPLLTFYFAILYAISTLIGVLTRNMLVAILVVLVAWGLSTLIGSGNNSYREAVARQLQYERIIRGGAEDDAERMKQLIRQGLTGADDANGPSGYATVMHYLHIVTPRTYDLDQRASWLIASGTLTDTELKALTADWPEPTPWGTVLGISAIFITLMLLLAYWRFVTRDG